MINNQNLQEVTLNETTEANASMKNQLKMIEKEQTTKATAAGAKEQQTLAGVVEPKRLKKVQEKKDFKPIYSDDEKEMLEQISLICMEEIEKAPSVYSGVAFGQNCIVDLRSFRKGGGVLLTPEVNRTHGNDQRTTGESMMTNGAQHPLMIMTIKMADAAGILCKRFENDPNQYDMIPDDSLVILDGNGRINYLMEFPVEKWPEIWGVFPSPDSAGYYNLPVSFDVINTKVSVWKTQDLVSKRIIMEGQKTHEGWLLIDRLVKNGFKYQAACQLATLQPDRLKKDKVNSGKADDTFKYFTNAKLILTALKDKFASDEVLKTKAVPMVVSSLWGSLRDKHGAERATEIFVNFINSLSSDAVKNMNEAKNLKGGASRDEQRRTMFEDAFQSYINENPENE